MRDATPIKLLLVESGRAVGGTERVVWELATRLPEARFDVRAWLSDDPGVDELAAALEQADVGVDRVDQVANMPFQSQRLSTSSGPLPTATCPWSRAPRGSRAWW